MYRLKSIILAGIFCICGLLASTVGRAAPVTADTALNAVQGWLRQDRHPLGAHLTGKIKRTDVVKNANGETLYYVVHLAPAGYVVMAADDGADPVIAFSATGIFDASPKSIMPRLLNRDVPKRLAQARARVGTPAALKSRSKWKAFLAGSANPPPDTEQSDAIVVPSQVWVAPFIQTLWGQQLDVSESEACYNYFTPQFGAGDTNNYPCGCVATCMAQTMFYFQYPTMGVGTASFVITNNGVETTASLRGGNGSGGPYQWTNMPLSPNLPTAAQSAAIGSLTYDAGLTINMSYTPANSTAATELVPNALMHTFKFGNASYFEDDNNGLGGTNLLNMINPNLDARLPVILGIQLNDDPNSGHCVVCDGYGYSASTLFHHLNAGWDGDNDIWYALPNINALDGDGTYNMIFSCVYNIYPANTTSQIISGRVTDPTGTPIPNATITASTYSATTDSNGIFSLRAVPAGTYTVMAAKLGYASTSGSYTTTSPVFLTNNSGNVWATNIILSPPLLVTPETGFDSVGPANGPFSITSEVYAFTNTSATSIGWTLTNTASWLSVSSSNGALAAGAISTLTVALNTNASQLNSGSYVGSIWITNLNNNLAQQLTFSLSVETGDYPIAVTGFNMDVIVESNAVGGNTINYADTFDPSCSFLVNPGTAVCFYEIGLPVANELENDGETSAVGFPPGGYFTNEADHVTTYQFAPYDSDNVLYLTTAGPSNSLTLSVPASYQSLSILAASTQGGGDGTLVIHFADGSASPAIAFNASNYQTTNVPGSGWAMTNFGQLVTGFFNEYGTLNSSLYYPTLYQTKIDLHSYGLDTNLISSVSFTMPGGTNANFATGIFALSGTESVFTGNYLLTVVPSTAAGGTATGSGSFGAGSVETVTATPANGYEFIDWSQGGAVVSTSTNYTFTLNSNTTSVANFLPFYTVTVMASPASGGTVLGGGTVAQGSIETLTAITNDGYQFVAWSSNATGTNKVLAVRVNTNLTITANFAPIGSSVSLSVLTNGAGKVSPRLGAMKLDHNYTLTATASNGYVFAGWTGSFTTNKDPFRFELLSDTVLQANFIPNPFLPLKGTYNGLFYVTNNDTTEVTETTAGMLKGLVIGQKGTYSGSLLINGASHPMSGTFSEGGATTNLIKRPVSQGDLVVEMVLTNGGSAPQITGTVSGTNSGNPWQAMLLADRATNTVPSAEYTLLIPPDVNNAPPYSSPGGDGYVSITNHAGTATLSGKLADGTAVNQNVRVSADGYVPIFANLAGNKGLLLGWITLDLTKTAGVGLTWIRSNPRGLYPTGFTNVITTNLLVSLWTNSHAAIASLTNLALGGTNTIGITISNNFKFGATSGSSPVHGSVNPKTGAFTIILGKGKSEITGYGAILQSPLQGGGYYLTNTSQGLQLGQ